MRPKTRGNGELAGLGGAAQGSMQEGLMLDNNMFVDCCCSMFLSLYLFVQCVTLGVSSRYNCNTGNSVSLKMYNIRGEATKTVGRCIRDGYMIIY